MQPYIDALYEAATKVETDLSDQINALVVKHIRDEAIKLEQLQEHNMYIRTPSAVIAPDLTVAQVNTITNESAGSITSTSAVISWDVSPAAGGQVFWGTSAGSLTNSGPLESNPFAAHTYTLTGLPADTTIYYRIDSGDASSAVLSFATSAVVAGPVAILPSDWSIEGGNEAVYASDYSSDPDFVNDGGATDAYRAVLTDVDQTAVDMRFDLPGDPQEVRLKYRFLLPSSYSSVWQEQDLSLKIPGLTGDTGQLNGGQGGSQNSYLDIPYRAWSARGLLLKPNTTSPQFNLKPGSEVYYVDSTNTDTRTNPGGFNWQFGQSTYIAPNGAASSADPILVNQWNQIEHRVKMNTNGNADGEFEMILNGDTANRFIRTDINWLEDFPGYATLVANSQLGSEWTSADHLRRIHRAWFDVFHGGSSDKTTAGDLVMFFRDWNYEVLN